jgi:hypothetical protein
MAPIKKTAIGGADRAAILLRQPSGEVGVAASRSSGDGIRPGAPADVRGLAQPHPQGPGELGDYY